jgi:hypothetical protein
MKSFMFVLFSKYNQNYQVKEMRWVENVARMERTGTRVGYWRENQKERDHWEHQDVGRLIIFR